MLVKTLLERLGLRRADGQSRGRNGARVERAVEFRAGKSLLRDLSHGAVNNKARRLVGLFDRCHLLHYKAEIDSGTG